MPLALDAIKPVKTLLGLLPWVGRGGQSDDLEDKIQSAIFKFKELEGKLAEIRIRFEKRIGELYSKMVFSLKRGERKRAEIYAQELVHLKKLLTLVKTAERILIVAVERVKTVRDVKELTEILLAFGAALDEVRSQMQGLYPGLALAFEEINKNIKLLILETAPPNITEIDTDSVAAEALRLLEEARKQVESEIEKMVPTETVKKILGEDIGEEIVATGKSKQLQQAVQSNVQRVSGSRAAVTSRGAAKSRIESMLPPVPVAAPPARPKPRRLSPEELERKLLDYIIEHGGFLDVSDFCNRYGVTREEVLAALNRLHAKGLIRLA